MAIIIDGRSSPRGRLRGGRIVAAKAAHEVREDSPSEYVMHSRNPCEAEALVDADGIASALQLSLLEWRVNPQEHGKSFVAHIQPRCASGGVRLIEFEGGPLSCERGRAEIATDGEEYLGILFQRAGSTQCRSGDSRTIIGPGEVSVWLSKRPAAFDMPQHFQKMCFVVPLSRFESVLHNASAYEGLHLSANSHLAALIGFHLKTLSQAMDDGPANADAATVDTTLELLGAAFRVCQSQPNRQPRGQLLNRIFRYMESHLDDASLTPLSIAQENGISVRYLYLLLSEQGTTVAGWIRKRRLARCRAELEDSQNKKTVTEIAYRWGFNDSASFSRLFKLSFGVSPSVFKASRGGGESVERNVLQHAD